MPHLASPPPFPYRSPDFNLIHRGVVTVTGNLLVDLKLKHDNFWVYPSIVGALTNLAAGAGIAWQYGDVAAQVTYKGTFYLTVGMFTSTTNPTMILSTNPVTISFLVYAEASVAS